MNIRKLSCLALSGVVASLYSTPLQAAQKMLYFGIVPQQAASRLAKMWVPFIDELSQRTGHKIQFATMKDIPTFEQCLAQGAYDISYMNPYHYTVFSEKSGYRALAHQADKKLKGLIVVRKDSPAKELKDLNTQKLAFPSPAAFGASVLPRAEMRAQGMKITPNYVKSHDSVYKSVIAGLFAAGGGVQRTFASIPDGMRDQLRVIYHTEAYTPHAFAVNATLSEKDMKIIRQAMLDISAERSDLIKGIGMKGLVSAQDENWNDVRALGLTQNETEIVHKGTVQCRFD